MHYQNKPVSESLSHDNKDNEKDDSEAILLYDCFSEQKLDLQKWEITRQGDFRENTIDIFDVDTGDRKDYRLRLLADTIGTKDDTVKYHGVRCLYKIDLITRKIISLDLDWNNQKNGCYLTAAIYICPTITEINPLDESNWLRIEYIGVPPGKNARCAISTRINDRIKHLYTEGWPEKKEGRHIVCQNIYIIIENGTFEIYENNKCLYASNNHKLNISSGYLYLQMSGHSNYPARDIYFDNVVIRTK